jgi:hypothetical protein
MAHRISLRAGEINGKERLENPSISSTFELLATLNGDNVSRNRISSASV